MANTADWTMDGIGTDGRLRHVVPMPMGMRVFLVICGLVVMIPSTNELLRAVWPPSLFGLPFAVILIGSFCVGVPMILAGLLAPTTRWTVARGRIDIARTNPFRGWHISITPGAVAEFSIAEDEGDGGPSTFRVILRTVEGNRYESRVLNSRNAADRLRRDIEGIFYG
jgi:hypothetical protein